MKKKNVLNLIKYYSEHNDSGFRTEAYEIAKEFDKSGDYQLSEYIMALLSNANTFIPQTGDGDSSFFTKLEYSQEPLPLPESIKDDVLGIVNAVGHKVGINKFLFQGPPGTGKTETAKQVARLLDRDLFSVDFNNIIDSKLGQTSKNIASLFDVINSFSNPGKVIILFDEIDALALDRTNSHDLREMGRATSSVLKGLDNLNEQVVLLATTNLLSAFDKALLRRFDSIIDFGRYTQEDLLEVAEIILDNNLSKFKFAGRNKKVFRKIMLLIKDIPYPGDLKNIIKTSIAFSNPGDEYDYLRRLYREALSDTGGNIKNLQEQGFTVREIELLTGVSKSQVSRELNNKEKSNE